MLARVLLHVVETSWPMDLAADHGRGQAVLQSMDDGPIGSIHHFNDRMSLHGAEIMGLAAGGRIEGRSIQPHLKKLPYLFSLNNAGFELGQIAV